MPAVTNDLSTTLDRTEAYILAHRFRGYDPYDALASPVFRLPVLRSQAFVRWGAQQALKRVPVQLRPLFGIRPGYNPVTLALVLQGFAYRAATGHRSAEHDDVVPFLVDELARLVSPGYSGACWGYDFDWQARYTNVPAYHPSIVATGFVTNALYELHRLEGIERAGELVAASLPFLRNDLVRMDVDDALCWSYTPTDRQQVLNATMKGTRLCAQAYELTGDAGLLDLAARSARFVVQRQRADGSWPYSVSDPRSWSDNFHTGYVLDCLDEYERISGDTQFREAKERGFAFYEQNFFTSDDAPKYFHDRAHPFDATSCGQSLLTLCRFRRLDRAQRVADWARAHLALPDGAWKYRIERRYENRLVYMRWSVAWMFTGLARVELDRR